MGEILQFPSGAPGEGDTWRADVWRTIAEHVRSEVRVLHLRDDIADWILSDLKPRVEVVFSETYLEVPTESAPLVQQVADFYKKGTARAVNQMITLEFDLFVAKFPDLVAPLTDGET